MITLILRLLAGSLLKNAAGEIRAGFGWLFSSATHALEAALALALAWGAYERHEASAWQGAAGKWKSASAEIKQACQAASDANARAQMAQKAAYEAKYREQADEADRHDNALAGDYARRLAAYDASHVVRPDQVGLGAPGASAQDHGAKGGDGPGAGNELVAVSPEDLKICTENTRRLQVVHDWAVAREATTR